MVQPQSGIKVSDLQNIDVFANSASVLALTDSGNNTVNLIQKENFISSLISTTSNNGLNSDSNGLYVQNIGNLANLETQNKTSVVNAINENTTRINQPITTLISSGTIALADNSINTITPAGEVTFNLPAISENEADKFHQILVQINLNTVYTINIGTNIYFNFTAPSFLSTGSYDLIYEYDVLTGNWVAGALQKGEQ